MWNEIELKYRSIEWNRCSTFRSIKGCNTNRNYSCESIPSYGAAYLTEIPFKNFFITHLLVSLTLANIIPLYMYCIL